MNSVGSVLLSINNKYEYGKFAVRANQNEKLVMYTVCPHMRRVSLGVKKAGKIQQQQKSFL